MTIRNPNSYVLPLWAAFLPLITINITFLVASGLEHVPSCIPYLEGCTSVSSTGRSAPESLIFRAGMLPTAVILIVFWHRCAVFLGLLGQSGIRNSIIRVAGLLAGVSLIAYALTLGYEDSPYRQLRRAAIIGFAVSTFAAEVGLITAYRIVRVSQTDRLWRWLIVLCVALPLLDIISEVAKWAGAPRKAANNAVAWNAFVAASLFYAVVARIWWRHGFSAEFRLGSGDRMSSGRPTSPSE